MTTQITVHHCVNVRLDRTYVQNANSVSLEIETDEDKIDITLFDLPAEVTDKLAALRDADTQDHKDRDETNIGPELEAAGIVERAELPSLPEIDAYFLEHGE